MSIGGVDVRAPDLVTIRQGVTEYWEVKYRARPTLDPETGEYEHWMPYGAFADYARVADRTGSRVNIVVYEEASTTEKPRWLVATSDELLDHGKRAARVAHDGGEVDVWLWRRRAMRVIAGPRLEHSSDHEAPPLFPVEGNGTALSSEGLFVAEKSLRVRRKEGGATRDAPVSRNEQLLEDDPVVGLDVLRRRLSLADLPRYSVWAAGISESTELQDVLALLDYGIRVFLVVRSPLSQELLDATSLVRAARLLQVSVVPDSPSYWVVDGQLSVGDPLSETMDAADQAFGINVEQYRIVHARSDQDIAVLAGAGTGKTETMTERIIFLLATVSAPPGVGSNAAAPRLDEIALVTFTQEAAQQMRERLARTLMLRRRLCTSNTMPILAWALQLGPTQISTVHAFARRLIEAHGSSVGLAPDFGISFRTVELRDFLASELSEPLEDLVASSLGGSTPAAYEWYQHFTEVAAHLENNGVTLTDVDWGPESPDPLTAEIQTLMQEALPRVQKYSADRAKEDQSLRLAELISTAVTAISSTTATAAGLRYIFVDEFQDTDLTQIDLLVCLRERFQIGLFIVGDVKQGIYRFRGATGNAFEELDRRLSGAHLGTTRPLSLTRNFRSAPRLLDQFHRTFVNWGVAGLLAYTKNDELRPGAPDVKATARVVDLPRPSHYAEVAAGIVSRWRSESRTASIGIVCRRNSEALAVQREVHALGLPCDVRVGGRFFLSPAVRELLVLMRAVVDPTDGAMCLQLLETRWAAGLLRERGRLVVGSKTLQGWGGLGHDLSDWGQRLSSLGRAGDVNTSDLTTIQARLLDLRSAASTTSPMHFIAECVTAFDPGACAMSGPNEEVERPRYVRCLDHLITLLDSTFPEGGGSLWRLIDWLDISVATNRDEDEPADVVDASGATVALTVHKAKGLQYDRVLIPRTWIEFGPPSFSKTEVLLTGSEGKQRLSWSWRSSTREFTTTEPISRSLEWEEVVKEEARLMYVAMTRAKNDLLVLRCDRLRGGTSAGARTWQDLLGGTL